MREDDGRFQAWCRRILRPKRAAQDRRNAEHIKEIRDGGGLKSATPAAPKGNLDAVDLSVGQRSERYSQMAASTEAAIARLEKTVTSRYGALGTLSGGLVSIDFQSKETDPSL